MREGARLLAASESLRPDVAFCKMDWLNSTV
jgi:hypothetical protein